MNIHDLEALVAVVETGSIVSAAGRLNLTQPGVTRRIQNLEQLLGAELLDRQTKPFKPTAAGREAYEHARRVIRSMDDLKAGLRSERETTGEFRLGVMPHLSEASLTRPLDRLRHEFPKLTLKIYSGWSQRLLDLVSTSALDAAAISLPDGAAPPAGLVGEDLGPQEFVLVAAKSLGVPKRPQLTDLSRFAWVVNEGGCALRDLIRHSFESARLPFNAAVEALSSELRMSLVARGLGLGTVTPLALSASPWRDDVEVVDAPALCPRTRSWVVHRPPAGRLSFPVALFASAVREELLEARL